MFEEQFRSQRGRPLPKFCPLSFFSFFINKSSSQSGGCMRCVEDQCAWWDEFVSEDGAVVGQCGFMSIVDSLRYFELNQTKSHVPTQTVSTQTMEPHPLPKLNEVSDILNKLRNISSQNESTTISEQNSEQNQSDQKQKQNQLDQKPSSGTVQSEFANQLDQKPKPSSETVQSEFANFVEPVQIQTTEVKIEVQTTEKENLEKLVESKVISND